MDANAFLPLRRQLALLVFALGTALCGGAVFAQAPLDPPGRVAQLNYFDGPVSFAPAGYEQWAGAVLNRPLTQGDRLWSDAGARSELHIGSTALRMDAQTSLAFSTLDDQTVQLTLTQGSLIARLRSFAPGQRFEVDTPNLAFTASQPGDYRIDVDPGTGTTRVTLQSGSAMVYGSDGSSASLSARQQITFGGASLGQVAGQSAPGLDPFDRWALARDRAEDQSLAARYVSREVIGYQQLDNYGDWEDDPAYGAVWVPRVTAANWAPYRVGHWASIAPWGWTWIDDEPWGFAPFHYGRWAQRGARWLWVPGAMTARPVYAPALVGFVGGSAGGVNFSLAVGGAAQAGVAWFPLAPGEAWHPSYRASPAYVHNVNRTVVHNNVTNITNVYRYQHLPAAVTAVPMAAFAQGQHVRGNARPVPMADLQRARVVAPPEPTRDPRSVFGASRLAQAHPAPAPEVQERRVVSRPALQHGRVEMPPVRAAQPGPAQAPALPAPPQAREFRGQPMQPRTAVPTPAPQGAPHPSLQPERFQQRQQMPLQDGQAQQEQQMRQSQRAQQEQQMQAQQRAQQEQQMHQALRAQQEQQMQTQQRAQQEQQRRQAQSDAQRPHPPQEPRAAPAPANRPRPGDEPQRPHREDPRSEQRN